MKNQLKGVGVNIESGFAFVRLYLGIGLFLKGVQFISNPDLLQMFWEGSQMKAIPVLMIHYISVAHLVGGILLAMGLVTRLAAFAQIPILFGAVFFVHWQGGILTQTQDFEFAALVLFLLCIFCVCGSGPLSFDSFLNKKPD